MGATDVLLPTADGTTLAGTVREPTSPRAAVVVAGATAVPERAYGGLADLLASQGLAVLTFDYRGVGRSAPRRLRADRTVMADWGRLDLDAALAWLQARHPERPLLLVGHSVGGQLLGLAPAAERLRGALLIGSQGGWWRNWRGAARWGTWLGWHLLLPATSTLLGYTPMRAFGMGEDLPAGVGLQWARWGRHPEYLLSECTPAERERYIRLGFPIRAYHFPDDGFAPRPAVEQLLGFYRGAPRELVTRSAAELGVPSVGHFGWLKPALRDSLWREVAGWLLARAEAVAGPQASGEGARRREAEAAGRRAAPRASGSAASRAP
jgi:predicted alpha/beta hydrolase